MSKLNIKLVAEGLPRVSMLNVLSLTRYEIASTKQYFAFLRPLEPQRLFALLVHQSLKERILQREVNEQKMSNHNHHTTLFYIFL